MYLGDIRLGDVLDCKFTTRRFSTGAPFTLAGTPVISAYPGNSLTQLTAGITLTVDFDAVTGLHNVRVVASGANGYATATNYALVITAGTVDGVSVVGEVIGSFSIEARSALMPTVAARTLDVSAAGEAGITQAGADKVWSSGTRTLTAFSTALAVAVWDVLEAAIATASSIGLKAKTNLDAAVSTRSSHSVADIWVHVIEGTFTAIQYMRLFASALCAKLSGAATTTVTIRDTGDVKARITATVDADGNRSAMTLDGT